MKREHRNSEHYRTWDRALFQRLRRAGKTRDFPCFFFLLYFAFPCVGMEPGRGEPNLEILHISSGNRHGVRDLGRKKTDKTVLGVSAYSGFLSFVCWLGSSESGTAAGLGFIQDGEPACFLLLYHTTTLTDPAEGCLWFFLSR